MHNQRAKLIKLAADILMDQSGPPLYVEEHQNVPKKFPVRWWRYLYDRLVAAENKRKDWAVQIREIADTLEQSP